MPPCSTAWRAADEILVGTPVRGRAQPHTEDVVGTFINTLVLRTDLTGAPTFAELLGRIRQPCSTPSPTRTFPSSSSP